MIKLINCSKTSPFFFVWYAVLSVKSKQFIGRKLLSGGGKKPRLFDRPECRSCVFKGSSYCWNQCPYNIWRKR